jgi:cation transporter family protein
MFINYKKEEPPLKDRPTEVKLGIYINSFYSISEQTMDYQVNIYLRQSWRDPRLEFVSPNERMTSIRFGNASRQQVWIPDTFFRNEKKAKFHTVTVDNKLMRVDVKGNVWYVSKISATLSCPMQLQKYPLDTQVCPILFESFGYTMDSVYFAWLNDPVDIDKTVQFPQFNYIDSLLYDCSRNYTAGAFPCQEIRFVLRRQIGYFFIQVFIPSILIVILSWVSFWINVESSPARVSIGLLSVLTTATQSSGINQSLPRVSYIKAIDVWMIVCLVFVFCALLEYAFVNTAARNGVRIRTPIVRNAAPLRTIDGQRMAASLNQDYNKHNSGLSSCWQGALDCGGTGGGSSSRIQFTVTVDAEASKRRARSIDKVSRKSFPIAFLMFNIVYWVAYTIDMDH